MQVVFHKRVHGCHATASSRDIRLRKELDMPFVPVIGMAVSSGDWDTTVKSLWWDDSHNGLWVFTEENKELYDADLYNLPHKRSLRDIVTAYLEAEWELDDVNRAKYADLLED